MWHFFLGNVVGSGHDDCSNVTCLATGRWDRPFQWPKCIEGKLLYWLSNTQDWEIIFLSFEDVQCSEPPPAPLTGTREWNGKFDYLTEAKWANLSSIFLALFCHLYKYSTSRYHCGHYAQFTSPHNNATTSYEEETIQCQWNKTWTQQQLHPCKCD